MAKVQDIMKFGQKSGQQLTVEQAKAAMIAAGEAPGSVRIKEANDARRAAFQQAQAAGLPLAEARRAAAAAAEAASATGSVPPPPPTAPNPGQTLIVRTAADQRAGVTEPVVTPTAVSRTQPVSAVVEKAERIETKKFVGVIKQENGLWVAEITYKNGAGTERFTATTKNQLMLKLLEGKANGTLKVRDVTRAAKLGEPEFDHAYKFEGVTQAQYDAMPDVVKDELIDAAAAKATIQFKEDYPEFLPTALNSQKVLDFLDARKAVITYGNLVKAFDALSATEQLETRTEEESPVLEGSIAVGDSTSVAASAPAVSTAAPVSASEPQVRKRGTTGIMPGFSSGSGNTDELDTPEEGTKQREPSRAELMKLSLADHRALYKQTLRQPNRSF